eukprot:Blabericola_migrator_1__13292@NODE_930_length_5997_cov_288_044013_g646_i0_p1_GENE_NODE_930_length_5997_cov_288_044013_g646_i0NODE_930_length_5997_cov_288_044013_g646_i0_p1_ORF_typecomplete_len584_score142_66Sec1/PF00995_23/9_4e75Corona_NS3b/PF03053_14/0_16AAA_27/PF13514_6/19AAA_27/PF13514_6/34_NODE_930_length_5997_cov_288_044013_g646_i018783629
MTSLHKLNNAGLKDVFGGLAFEPRILYVDEEVKLMLTLVMSFNEILDCGFYVVEALSKLMDTSSIKSKHLSCVIICRPTSENLLTLSLALKKGIGYKEYHLLFTNTLEYTGLEKLARSDTNFSLVTRVLDVYMDYYVMRPRLFTFELLNVSKVMHIDKTCWQPYEDAIFLRSVQGLAALILSVCKEVGRQGVSLDLLPVFRISGNSPICSMLAVGVVDHLARIWAQALKSGNKPGAAVSGVTVMIMDRREDLISVLLNPWTYQAMLHEHLGIRVNKVKLRDEEINLDPTHDTFLKENAYKTFGDITAITAAQVKKAKQQSSENLRQILDDYSEKKRQLGLILKHGDLVHTLTDIVTQEKLIDASLLEQKIACGAQHQLIFNVTNQQDDLVSEVMQFLQSSDVSQFEKFRLIALHMLRQLSSPNIEESIVKMANTAKLISSETQLLKQLKLFMSDKWKSVTAGEEWNVLSAAKEALSRIQTTSVPGSQLMQYHSRIRTLVELTLKGSLDYKLFPVVTARPSESTAAMESKTPPRVVVLFVVGGITYEEAREIELLGTNSQQQVYVGGTCMTNSKTLLADVSLLT